MTPKGELEQLARVTILEAFGFEQLLNNTFEILAKNLAAEYVQHFVVEVCTPTRCSNLTQRAAHGDRRAGDVPAGEDS